MISVFISIAPYTNDRRRLNRENSSKTLQCGVRRGLCPFPENFGILFPGILHFGAPHLISTSRSGAWTCALCSKVLCLWNVSTFWMLLSSKKF